MISTFNINNNIKDIIKDIKVIFFYIFTLCRMIFNILTLTSVYYCSPLSFLNESDLINKSWIDVAY